MSAALRALLPREHGLNAWVGVPLVGALALAPTAATLGCVLGVIGGFGAFNALRRGERGPALGAALFGALCAVPALATLPRPLPALVAFALGGTLAGLAVGRWGRAMPREAALEALCIPALCGLGAALAVAAGAPVARAVALGAVLASWQITGLWWVRRALADVLPGRRPWAGGAAVALAVALVAFGLGLALGEGAVAALVVAQPVRLWLHRAPRSAREAPRMGFTELGWALAVVLVGGAL